MRPGRSARGAPSCRAGPRRAARGVLAIVVLTACVDASGGRLLVTSGATDQVFVLDADDGRVLDSLDLDRRPGERDEPHGVEVAPDGKHWYATLAHGEPSLWKVETDGDRVVGRLTLDAYGASRVRLSPDGAMAAVPDYWLSGGGAPSRVAFVRTHDLVLLGAPELCAGPHDAAYSPDGATVAVTCALDDRVVLVDAGTQEVRGAVDLGAGARPMNAAWAPDGDALYVTLMGEGAVAALSAGPDGHREVGRLRVGARPAQLAVSPDGRRVVVANRGDGTVSVLEIAGGGGRVSRTDLTLPGAHPHGVAFGARKDVAWVTWEGATDTYGGVAAIDLPAGRVLWATEVGQYTLGVAWAPTASR